MRKFIFTAALLAALMVSQMALAAPLDDYGKAGNFAVGAYYRHSKYTSEGEEILKKSGFGLDLAGTVSKKIALEFSYNGADKKTDEVGDTIKFLSYDFNVKYMACKTDKIAIMPYVGLSLDRIKVDENSDSWKETRTQAVIGATGVFKLADKMKAYADLGLGGKLFRWKLGLAYEVVKNLDVDLGYAWRRVKMDNDLGEDFKITRKGIMIGLTYKFQ
jgi:opacity protein-like surface antigen